jgi:hypothetical protein
MLKKFQKYYHKLSDSFEKHFGWFFTNGRKTDADLDWLTN